MNTTVAIWILVITFFVLIFLSFPVAYAIGIASVVGMMYMGLNLQQIVQLMVKGVFSFRVSAVLDRVNMTIWKGITMENTNR